MNGVRVPVHVPSTTEQSWELLGERDWEKALSLIGLAEAEEAPLDVIGYNAGASACNRASSWRQSLKLLSASALSARSIRPSEITYHANLTACRQSGSWQACTLPAASWDAYGRISSKPSQFQRRCECM